MEEASKRRDPPPYKEEISNEKQLPMTSTTNLHFQHVTPIWRLSPRHGGSTLYDSYELRAVTQQLNRAIQGSQASPSIKCPANSPFYYPYRRCLDRVRKENAKTPKRVTASRLVGETHNVKECGRSARGLIPRVWKKLKRMFMKSK